MRGRAQGQDPWCRSVCIRKVFPHEVRRVLRIVRSTPAGLVDDVVEEPRNIPLPPEGQSLPGWLTGRRAPDAAPADDDGEYDPDALRGWASVANDRAGAPPPAEHEVWREGYYVWMSRSKWAAQEKLDTMAADLAHQAQWVHMKRDINDRWEKDGVAALMGRSNNARVVLQDVPFPDTAASSLLVPVPPPFPPILKYMDNLLAPTRKVLSMTHDSIVSGDQQKFAGKIWEKSLTDQPFVLARKVFDRVLEVWNKRREENEGNTKPR